MKPILIVLLLLTEQFRAYSLQKLRTLLSGRLQGRGYGSYKLPVLDNRATAHQCVKLGPTFFLHF